MWRLGRCTAPWSCSQHSAPFQTRSSLAASTPQGEIYKICIYVRKYVYMRSIDPYIRIHALVYTSSSALRAVRRSAHTQFLRREVIYILCMLHMRRIYTCTYAGIYVKQRCATKRSPATFTTRGHIRTCVAVCTCDRIHALISAYWVWSGRCRANSVLSCSFRHRSVSCPGCSTFIG